MNRDIRIEFNEYETELKDFFGDTSIELIDILDACTNLIIENKRLVEENEELEQMGTTMEICLVYKNKVYINIPKIKKVNVEKTYFTLNCKHQTFVYKIFIII